MDTNWITTGLAIFGSGLGVLNFLQTRKRDAVTRKKNADAALERIQRADIKADFKINSSGFTPYVSIIVLNSGFSDLIIERVAVRTVTTTGEVVSDCSASCFGPIGRGHKKLIDLNVTQLLFDEREREAIEVEVVTTLGNSFFVRTDPIDFAKVRVQYEASRSAELRRTGLMPPGQV